jgi:hypothetical protein
MKHNPIRQADSSFTAGDEFYLKEWPQVEGYSFREVLISFPKATPIGVKEFATQSVVLNPEDTYIIQPGTRPWHPLHLWCLPFSRWSPWTGAISSHSFEGGTAK